MWRVVARSEDNDLEVYRDGEWSIIHKHVYTFGLQGSFLFVSVFLDANDVVSAASFSSQSSSTPTMLLAQQMLLLVVLLD